jgi:hypothetical protein
MLEIKGTGADREMENGRLNVLLRQKSADSRLGIFVLAGDKSAGPLVSMASTPPQKEPPSLIPAHGHGCDNWRITLGGRLRMGRREYHPGEFRFQRGGQPYGSDDSAAWGPDGGQSFLVMADWRGFPVDFVKKDADPDREFLSRIEAFEEMLGRSAPDVYPGHVGLASSLGAPAKGGQIEGSFAQTDRWNSTSDGVRTAVSLLGDHGVGPVVLLIDASPQRMALPAMTLNSELILVVVAGTGSAGAVSLREAQVSIIESGVACPAIDSGSDGLHLAVLIADRRALTSALSAGQIEGGWTTAVSPIFGDLMASLEAPALQ